MTSKRHHYVPQFYLNYFVDESSGVFWVYDKEGGEREQTPINTTVESYFYSFDIPGIGKTDVAERLLARVESSAKPVVDRWQLASTKPETSERDTIALFLGFMHARVPRTMEAARELIEVFVTEEAKRLPEQPEILQRAVERYGRRHPDDPAITLEEMTEIVRTNNNKFRIEVDGNYPLSFSLQFAPEIADELLSMNWCLCAAPTGSFFLTSDAPLNVFAPAGVGRAIFGGGLRLPGVEVAFPISPTLCLLLDRSHTQSRRRVSNEVVLEINRRLAWGAERFVISTRKAKFVRRLVTESAHTRALPKVDRQQLEDLYRRAGRES